MKNFKKVIAGVMALALTLIPMNVQAEARLLRGDVNLDGVRDEADYELLKLFLTQGEEVFTIDRDKQITLADVNGNETIDEEDAEFLNNIITIKTSTLVFDNMFATDGYIMLTDEQGKEYEIPLRSEVVELEVPLGYVTISGENSEYGLEFSGIEKITSANTYVSFNVLMDEADLESIPYETIKEEDDTLYEGEEVLVQEGKYGTYGLVDYDFTFNGKTVNGQTSFLYDVKPVNEIVKVGTKQEEQRPVEEFYNIKIDISELSDAVGAEFKYFNSEDEQLGVAKVDENGIILLEDMIKGDFRFEGTVRDIPFNFNVSVYDKDVEVVMSEMEESEEAIAYDIDTVLDETRLKGDDYVMSDGKPGYIRKIVIKGMYDGEEIVLAETEERQEPVNEVLHVGTKEAEKAEESDKLEEEFKEENPDNYIEDSYVENNSNNSDYSANESNNSQKGQYVPTSDDSDVSQSKTPIIVGVSALAVVIAGAAYYFFSKKK